MPMIYLMYPSGREPMESVCRGEAELGTYFLLALKWTNLICYYERLKGQH